jgi:hypothetical protein
MSGVSPSFAAYVQIDHLLAETGNEGLEIGSRINIEIHIQELGI